MWALMKKHIEDTAPKYKNNLIKNVKSVWANTSKVDSQTLVNCLSDRVRDVIKTNEVATKY